MERRSLLQQSARRKFFNWMMNWYYDKHDFPKVNEDPEVIDVVRLLKSSGFQLREVDTSHVTDKDPVDEAMKRTSCKVVVTCAYSNLRVVMESTPAACRCSHGSKSDGHVWEVVSTAPSTNKVNPSTTEVGSSYIPEVPSAVGEVVRPVVGFLYRLMDEPLSAREAAARGSRGSYGYLQVPGGNLALCNLRGSAPELYSPQDSDDAQSPLSGSERSPSSLALAMEAMEVDEEMPALKMKSKSFDCSVSSMDFQDTTTSGGTSSSSSTVFQRPLPRRSPKTSKAPPELDTSFLNLIEHLYTSLSLAKSLRQRSLRSEGGHDREEVENESPKGQTKSDTKGISPLTKLGAVAKSSPATVKRPGPTKLKVPSKSVLPRTQNLKKVGTVTKTASATDSVNRIGTPRPSTVKKVIKGRVLATGTPGTSGVSAKVPATRSSS